MGERPDLDITLDSTTFREYYYLKEELVDFCRKHNLQSTGGKLELTDRIAEFLDTGKRSSATHIKRKSQSVGEITLDTVIESNFVCSEKHRAFYKEHIGNSFSFNVLFQKWLKSNAGKTYRDSIDAYYQILEDKKKNKTAIDKQFEYNTYIRDFFDDNTIIFSSLTPLLIKSIIFLQDLFAILSSDKAALTAFLRLDCGF